MLRHIRRTKPILENTPSPVISISNVNKNPNEPLDPLRAEFIKYILSKDGQIQTEQGGYYPIISDVREAELKRLGLSGLHKMIRRMAVGLQSQHISGNLDLWKT